MITEVFLNKQRQAIINWSVNRSADIHENENIIIQRNGLEIEADIFFCCVGSFVTQSHKRHDSNIFLAKIELPISEDIAIRILVANCWF